MACSAWRCDTELMAGEASLLLAVGIVSPLILIGGVVLSAVPLMIHLLYRHRYQDRPWAAMQFLAEAVRKQARRVRLESLVLLVVRTLLILFAAVALSQPFTERSGRGDERSAPRHRMLIIDVSLSMSAADGGRTSLANARDIAARIVREAPPGDAFHLVRIAGTPPYSIIRHAAHEVDQVLQEIEQLDQTEEKAGLTSALEAAIEQMSREADADWTVYVLSDFQRANWTPKEALQREEVRVLLRSVEESAELVLIDAAGAMDDNVAVATLVRDAVAAPVADFIDVTATLQNFDVDQARERRVELVVNGRSVDGKPVTIPAGTSLPVTFRVPAPGSEESAVEVRLSEDRLSLDDRRRLVLPAQRSLDVLLVGGPSDGGSLRGSAGFVELALSPGIGDIESPERPRAMTPTVVSDGRLPEIDLSRYACVFLCDVPLVTETEARLLRSYVQAGGGLVISLGPRSQVESYNRVLFGGESGLMDGQLWETVATSGVSEEGYRFEPRQYAHPILQPFAGNVDAGLLTTEVYRYVRFEAPRDSTTRTVLQYSTGDAAIVEDHYGAGRVFLVTTALDDTWSNWALWPSFVPMIHELAREAAAGGFESRQLSVGESIVRRLHSHHADAPVELIGPDGESQELNTTSVTTEPARSGELIAGGRRSTGLLAASPPIESSGIYRLRIGDPANVSEYYAVNVDTVESDLSALDEHAISRDLLPEADFRFLTGWSEAHQREIKGGAGRTSLTKWSLTAVLCLLMVDLLMAWRFTVGAAVLVTLTLAALSVQLGGVSPLLAVPSAGLLVGVGLMLARRRGGPLPSSIASSR